MQYSALYFNSSNYNIQFKLPPLAINNPPAPTNNWSMAKSQFLTLPTIQRMLAQLLARGFHFYELAQILGITEGELCKLSKAKKCSESLIAKINLPLIKLYCRTVS